MKEKERQKLEKDQKVDTDRIFTLPNILSMLRVALIPILVWLFFTDRYWIACLVVLLSGLTDIIDGWIARKFHQVSNFGKAFDPVADKLTQAALMFCLLPKNYWWLLGVMAFKESVIGILSLITMRKTGKVFSAGWYGKLCTVVIYCSMFVLILWRNPHPAFVMGAAIAICAAIALAFVKYFIYFTRILKEIRQDSEEKQP